MEESAAVAGNQANEPGERVKRRAACDECSKLKNSTFVLIWNSFR